ncbi:uncharacterized protein Dwil_GK27258 [Drosophila willistoni]|uniref:uncharacterized protein LOC26529260 n=1 Tax=Drosophila willistoni TaxID=7260 RepID=UPI000732A30E|nr:uncharacterized protein LOC26529260 [Drosophila willistoni]KRF98033.1 uncharacterized protein Dwil_GK27258 [Drosophila willistoni]
MRACLLYLCIFTLLQSRYVLSRLVRPEINIPGLFSILYSCQREVNGENNVGSLLTLDNESTSNKRVDLKSSARTQGDGAAQSSSNVNIRNGERVLSISNSVDSGQRRGRLPRRSNNGRNDQSSVDSSVSVNLGDALSNNNPLRGSRIVRLKPYPRTAQGKKSNPISISIGDSNANNQIIQEDSQPTQPPRSSSLLDLLQPRSPWGVGINIQGGKSKPKTVPLGLPLRNASYGQITSCVIEKILKQYQSSFSN